MISIIFSASVFYHVSIETEQKLKTENEETKAEHRNTEKRNLNKNKRPSRPRSFLVRAALFPHPSNDVSNVDQVESESE